jgi:hypothetical protein
MAPAVDLEMAFGCIAIVAVGEEMVGGGCLWMARSEGGDRTQNGRLIRFNTSIFYESIDSNCGEDFVDPFEERVGLCCRRP